MKSVLDPHQAIRHLQHLDAPAVTVDNPTERGWAPRDRGPYRRTA
jgi:hypothetical protein